VEEREQLVVHHTATPYGDALVTTKRGGIRYGDALVYHPRHRATNTQEHAPHLCVDCGWAAASVGRHRAEG
jgi:hypothetical protein